jgi:hypothetical protein
MQYIWPTDKHGKRKPVHEMTEQEQADYAAEFFPAANKWCEAFAAACAEKERRDHERV